MLWDAAEYDQQNPLYTDENGCYAWDVPEGLWQVKYEKEGYETAYSDWLPVPPPQLEVNIGMISKEEPVIESLTVYSDHADVVFSKYMAADTISSLQVSDSQGNNIPYQLIFDNTNKNDEGVVLAKEYTLEFENGMLLDPGSICSIKTAGEISSYSGVTVSDLEKSAEVIKNTEIIAPDNVTVKMGENMDIPVCVVNGTEDMIIHASTGFEEIANVTETSINSVQIHGNMYGDTTLQLIIEGTNICKTINIHVGTISEIETSEDVVALPQTEYSIQTGEKVEIIPTVFSSGNGDGVWTITKGSDDLIEIEGNTFYAKGEGTVTVRYSLVENAEAYAECNITVYSTESKGDVNEDGSLNVADLMMSIQHVSGRTELQGAALWAADVNGDGTVNVVDLMRLLHYISGRSSTL